MHKSSRSIRNINNTPGGGHWGLEREGKNVSLYSLYPLHYLVCFFIFFPWEYVSCIAKILLKINNYNTASSLLSKLDCETVFKCNFLNIDSMLAYPTAKLAHELEFLLVCHHPISLPSPTATVNHHVFLLVCLVAVIWSS